MTPSRWAMLCLLAVPACAADPGKDEADATATAKPLFESTEPVLDVTITFAQKAAFVRDGDGLKDDVEVPGKLAAPSLGVRKPVDILVKVRGNTSLIKGECSFPKLSFKLKNAADAAGSALANLKKIKIATHCGELPPAKRTPFGRVANEIAPHREAFVHLVLRTAGLEAPRARPVVVTYVNTSAGNKTLKRKATFVEDVDDIAKRLGGKASFIVESEEDATDERANDPAATELMSPDEIAQVHLVESLIGNDDWRLNRDAEARWLSPDFREPLSFFWNMKAVRLADGKERPVPVDFDLTRIVAPTPGSAELPELWSGTDGNLRAQLSGLMHERMRLSRAELDGARRALLEKREAIEKTLETPWLDAEAKDTARKMFTHFFELMTNDEAFYVPVTISENDRFVELLDENGVADDRCIANSPPDGTPVHAWGVKKPELGIEQVSFLDVGLQLPCNRDRVWVKSADLHITTDFPRRAR
jgi:hypothetical protein